MSLFAHPTYSQVRDEVIVHFRQKIFQFQHLKPVVFLCGARESYNRNILRDYLIRHHSDLFIFYAEDVWEHVAKRERLNALEMEEELATLADLVIILVESPGTFTELGAFALSDELRKKIYPIVDNNYKDDNSFINTGPIKWINEDSNYAPPLYVDYENILIEARSIDEQIQKIPRRGRLVHYIESRKIKDRPKHLLFLLCDLIAVIGPAPKEECEHFLREILENEPLWSVSSLLGLARSLNLIQLIEHPTIGDLYFRPLHNGQLESFQHPSALDLPKARIAMLGAYQKIPEIWKLILNGMELVTNA